MGSIGGEVILDLDGRLELSFLHDGGEVLLVDVDRLALLDRSCVGGSGEVAEHEDAQRELDVLGGAVQGRFVTNVDALFWRGGHFSIVCHRGYLAESRSVRPGGK